MKKVIIYIMVVSFFSISLTGCAAFQKKASTEGPYVTPESMGVSSSLKFDDVPIPAGFKIVDSDSFTFQNRDLRIGLLRYTGRVSGDQTVSFYKENMPMYNWSLINIVEYGRRIMNFERAGQSCIITAEPSSFYTILTIAVAPRATAPMKEEAKEYKEYKVVK